MTRPERAVLVRHPLAMVGIAITTAAAVVFVALSVAMFVGLLENPYAGLVVFIHCIHSIRLIHRVAGPLARLKNVFPQIGNGNLLRQGLPIKPYFD